MLAADSKVVSAPTADSLNPEPAGSWKQIIDPVEPFLEAVAHRLARQVEAFDPALQGYADYALNGQGKHLRPALVALTARALDGPGDEHVTIAVIIEAVHLATLIHDDIMDEAEIRRGRPTLAANWGNDIAVLFGDCLFAHALKLAASFPTPEICRAVAGATQTVCSGEILQTQRRGDLRLTREQYFRILEMKTAELFALSCDLSACLCGAAPDTRHALRQFGLALGTAYQVYDDCVQPLWLRGSRRKILGHRPRHGQTDSARAAPPGLRRHRRPRATPGTLADPRARRLGPTGAAVGEVRTLWPPHWTLSTSTWPRPGGRFEVLPPSNGRLGLFGLCHYLARQTDALRLAPGGGL